MRKQRLYNEVLKAFNSAAAAKAETLAKLTKARDDAAAKITQAAAGMEAMTDPESYTAARNAKKDAEGEFEFFTKKIQAQEEAGLMDAARRAELREKLAQAAAKSEKDAEADLRPRLDALFNDALEYLAELENIHALDCLLKENKEHVNVIMYGAPDLLRAVSKCYVTSGLYPGMPGELDRKWRAKLEEKKKSLRHE